MSHRHPESVHIHCVRWHQAASQQDVCCSIYQNFPLLSCCPISSRNWMHRTGTARLIGQDNQHDTRNSVKTNNEEENLRQDHENSPSILEWYARHHPGGDPLPVRHIFCSHHQSGLGETTVQPVDHSYPPPAFPSLLQQTERRIPGRCERWPEAGNRYCRPCRPIPHRVQSSVARISGLVPRLRSAYTAAIVSGSSDTSFTTLPPLPAGP